MMVTLTNEAMADALDAFWNAAISDAHGKGYDTMQVASLMATGFAAVAQALRDQPDVHAETVAKQEARQMVERLYLMSERYGKVLERPDYKPSRAQIESCRNTMQEAAECLARLL